MEYHGEYGSEICMFIPHINYLRQKDPNLRVKTYDGMQPYYFFMDPKAMSYKKQQRTWVPCPSRTFLPPVLRNDDEFFRVNSSCNEQQVYPDYYSYYKQFKMESSKPILIIQNKYNMEWGGPPINYIKTETLEQTLPHLCSKFKVIYIRSNDVRVPGYSDDVNEMYEFQMNDKDMIREKFPEVTIFEDMLKEFPQYDFNTLKCIILANAHTVVTALGGAHSFAVCYPCNHIIHRCERAERFPDYIYKPPYNLDPHVTTPDVYTRQWFQNTHDVACVHHPHGQLKMTQSHEELHKELMSLA